MLMPKRAPQNFCLCLATMTCAKRRCCNLRLKKDLILATVELPHRREPKWPAGLLHKNNLVNVIVEMTKTVEAPLTWKTTLTTAMTTATSTSLTELMSR